MHIAIEGMDGVGKTTIARELARKINFEFIEKPLNQILFDSKSDEFFNYKRITEKINNEFDCDFKAWFYGLGNLFVKSRYYDKDIVTDRHIVSNYFWNRTKKNDIVFKALIQLIGMPDFTFLIYASPPIRYNRISSRDKNDPDLAEVFQNEDAYIKMIDFLEINKCKYEIIDNSLLEIENTLEIIMKSITPYLMLKKNTK
jgi:thymidylate kinase